MNFAIDIAIGLLFVLGTVGFSLAVYWLTRQLAGPAGYERHKEMASAMVTRTAALHGLILALVFAQEMAAYQRLDGQTAAEATAIADVYNDAGRYGPAAKEPLQLLMRSYLDAVVGTEWALLGQGKGLDVKAWAEWEAAYDVVLNLVPTTPRETTLREHMLAGLHAISASRNIREAEAVTSLVGFFWLAAISGVILIAAGHYIYAPERQNLILLSLFSAYTGAILFLIYGFANPYAPPAELSPAPLLRLQSQLVN